MNYPKALGPYSIARSCGELVFASGQLPIDPATGEFVAGDIKELTRQCLRNLDAVLKEHGSCLAKALKTTVFLADLADFAAANEAYAEFFSEPFPARSCVQVAALPKGSRIEIEVIAHK